MKLFRTNVGPLLSLEDGSYGLISSSWDDLLSQENLADSLRDVLRSSAFEFVESYGELLPPVVSQEVWAAGVTYLRSREARMEESKSAGGGDFYDRVYSADRPELFFKSAGHRVVGHEQHVRLRGDATWSVPEPELVLVLSPKGRIQGFTIGNDMSSRDIEGENPLYLPQAKTYNGSCAIGPCLFVTDDPLPTTTEISIRILRSGGLVFEDRVSIDRIKRPFEELAGYLFRELSFPHGALLMTGTGIVPPDSFTLASGDRIEIQIPPIGALCNTVA